MSASSATFEPNTSLLITGAAGFIGHHMVEHILRFEPNVERIVVLDRLDESGNLMRFPDMDCWEKHGHRMDFVYHDLKAPIRSYVDQAIGDVDYVLHLAAASHVDRSITYPMEFVMDNVVGTGNLLDWMRSRGTTVKRGLYFSTDEVYGPAPGRTVYSEGDRHNPGNPYAASKAAAESLVRAYRNTYQMPFLITNTMNVFGERQHPEKFIPMTIAKCLRGDTNIIHSSADRLVAGSRFYLHARNATDATLFVLLNGEPFESDDASSGTYHIVGEVEVDNLTLARMIYDIVRRYEEVPAFSYEMVDFHSSRPGHDLRYGMSGHKLAQMGFEFGLSFEESLARTVKWTLERKEWLLP